MTCDGYWSAKDAPPKADADHGPIRFVVETGAQPLEFSFYIPQGHPCGVVTRSGEHGKYFSERLRQEFLSRACRWAEQYFEPEGLIVQNQKYRKLRGYVDGAVADQSSPSPPSLTKEIET